MSASRWLYWAAQSIGWSSYCALMLLATYADEPSKVDVELLLHLSMLVVFSVFSTHIMRYVFIKLNWLELRPSPLLPRVILASFLCSLLIFGETTFSSFVINPKEFEQFSVLSVVINILAILVLVLFWNAIYFTFHFIQKSRKQELNNISLEAIKNEIELKNLRSQLNPHFLFNSLNSIRALIELDPSKAKESLTTLSNLLRKSLIYGKETLVQLEDEINMVSHYLELEKIRFEERLKISWKLDESLRIFPVPPFILQMLVENAIKHGISNLIDGGEIEIQTRKSGEQVIIEVINSGKLRNEKDTGIGIQNVLRRLDIQYKGAAEFELIQQKNIVIARLTFKTEL